MENYFTAKQILFRGDGAAPPEAVVLNADDEYARRIEPPRGAETIWYGIEAAEAPAAGRLLRAVEIRCGFEGLRFDVETEGRRISLHSPLIGRINVYNILAACGAGLAPDWTGRPSPGAWQPAGPSRRFQRVEEGQPFLVASTTPTPTMHCATSSKSRAA